MQYSHFVLLVIEADQTSVDCLIIGEGTYYRVWNNDLSFYHKVS